MKFLADAHVSVEMVAMLRDSGHDCLDAGPCGRARADAFCVGSRHAGGAGKGTLGMRRTRWNVPSLWPDASISPLSLTRTAWVIFQPLPPSGSSRSFRSSRPSAAVQRNGRPVSARPPKLGPRHVPTTHPALLIP